MPTISPTVRASIGPSSEEFKQPRAQVKATTGMNLPPVSESKPPVDSKNGQSGINEDTQTPAVTLSPQLTALARKQQKLQQEIQAQRDKEAAWVTKESNYVPKDQFKAKLQQNAVEALKDLGLDYEELTNLLLNQQNGDDPVKKLESKITQLEKAQEENVSKQYDATLKQYRAETDSLISSDPKAYFLITKGSHQDAVVQHIVDTWKEDDTKILSVDQAAKEVEEFLREQARAQKKLLEELEGPPAETTATKKLPPPKQVTRTLTNQVESSPTRTYGQFQHLSMKERIAQAVARANK